MYTLFVRRKMRLTGRLVQAAPQLSMCVLHTWDDFTQTTWGSTQWHFVPIKHTPADPPLQFICTLSFTSFSGMVSVWLQTVLNYSQFVKYKYHLCLSIWGQCVKDVFSTNLVKLSRQESVHFVEHSRDGRQEWFGPGFKVNNQVNHQACLLTMFRGNEGKMCQHTLISSFHHWKDDVMFKPHILRQPVI